MKNVMFDMSMSSVLFVVEQEIFKKGSRYSDLSGWLPIGMEEQQFYRLLGGAYLSGEYTQEIDYFKAEKYLNISCRLENMEACYSLAEIYKDGDLGEKDFSKALEYYQKSAFFGECRAFFKIGTIYDFGLGVKQDLAKAAIYYKKACDSLDGTDESCLRNTQACHNLAVMLEEGDGIKQDFQKAALLYQKAIDFGNINAYRNLAFMYMIGRGVEVDISKAKQLLEDACEKNDIPSCELLRELNA